MFGAFCFSTWRKETDKPVKIVVTRTSISNSISKKDEQPCHGAVLERCLGSDERDVNGVMKIPYYALYR